MQLIYDSTIYDIGTASQVLPERIEMSGTERKSAGGIIFRQYFGVRTGEYSYFFNNMSEDEYKKIFNFYITHQLDDFQINDDIGRQKTVKFKDNSFNGSYIRRDRNNEKIYQCEFMLIEVVVDA